MKIYLLKKATYLKILHIHTGFNDYCLFWYSYGKLIEIFFIRIQ